MSSTFNRRATSPLHFESAPYAAEAIICPGSEEEDSSEEHRSKKRRRVEIAGRQYLQGRDLFIQTALLKGPLEHGWSNPWARVRSGYGWDDVRRYPKMSKNANTIHDVQDPPTEEHINIKRRLLSRERPRDIGTTVSGEPKPSEPSSKRRRHGDLDRIVASSRSKNKSPSYSSQHGHNKWLKRNGVSYQAHFQGHKSPTPTPASKGRLRTDRSNPRISPPIREHVPSEASCLAHDLMREENSPLEQGHANGLTKIDPHATARRLSASRYKPPQSCDTSPFRDARSRATEISLVYSDDAVRKRHVKRLSQEAVQSAGEAAADYPRPKELPQGVVSKTLGGICKMSPKRLAPYVSESLVIQNVDNKGRTSPLSGKNKSSPRTSPPAANQPGFEYHVGRKASDRSCRDSTHFVKASGQARTPPSPLSPSTLNVKAEVENGDAARRRGTRASPQMPSLDIKHAETKARLETMRRLTFTASGGPKVALSRPITRFRPDTSIDAGESVEKVGEDGEQKPAPSEGEAATLKTSLRSSDKPLTNGNHSKSSSGVLPEAQIIPDGPLPPPKVVSGPSTNLLETDKESPKLPFCEEGDSYLNLSTQAALLKAQRSFKGDVLANLTDLSSKTHVLGGTVTTPQSNGCHRRLNSNGQQAIKSLLVDHEEPMSTQAMIDEMSPFATTTLKKRPPALKKRTSFAPTPTKAKPPAPRQSPTTTAAFPTYSPNMSTSPETSSPHKSPITSHAHPERTLKPPTSSTLTSFSILPNGTLTEESVLQEGQQPQQPIPEESYTSLPGLDIANSLSNRQANGSGSGSGSNKQSGHQTDLDAAIEDAGNFLGNWDVETEARRAGVGNNISAMTGSGKRESLGGRHFIPPQGRGVI